MSAPRVEIELDKLIHNAQKLTALYGSKGIRVTGVTKGVCGSPITTAGFSKLARRWCAGASPRRPQRRARFRGWGFHPTLGRGAPAPLLPQGGFLLVKGVRHRYELAIADTFAKAGFPPHRKRRGFQPEDFMKSAGAFRHSTYLRWLFKKVAIAWWIWDEMWQPS